MQHETLRVVLSPRSTDLSTHCTRTQERPERHFQAERWERRENKEKKLPLTKETASCKAGYLHSLALNTKLETRT